MKSCTNCRGNLADFVTVCPYCGVPQPVPQVQMPQGGWEMPRNSNKAIASLVCGVLFCFGPFANLPAIILGHLSLSDIKRSGGRMAGKGLAIAGLVLGYIGITLSAAYIIFIVIMMRTTMGKGIPVNETTAIINMRAYTEALNKYTQKCPGQGYPKTLASLGPGAGDCKHANLLDPRLAVQVPVRQGYMFEYSTGVTGPEKITAFALVARPVTPGFSGQRFFYVDESGVIRESSSQIIGPNSPPLGESQNSANEEKNEAGDDAEDGQYLRSNETAAISTMTMYNDVLKKYAKKCPQQVYPATLSPLGPGTGGCQHANLVDSSMAGQDPVHQGYTFQYSTGVNGPEKVTIFALVARPVTPGVTGNRYFYLDESGVIRESPNQNIGPRSDPLGGSKK